MRRARLVIRLGQYYDETSKWSHWHIPEAHYLETWSDSRAFDGTATIQQPLIMPLYGGKSVHEILTYLVNQPDLSSHDIVKGYWSTQLKGGLQAAWRRAIHDGVVGGMPALAEATGLKAPALPALPAQSSGGTEIVFRPDPTIGDGSWANNGWLQELPKPQTKMTWDNTIWVSPKDATSMNLEKGDMLRVTVEGRSVDAPVWILPGHAEGSFTVHFGYGRPCRGAWVPPLATTPTPSSRRHPPGSPPEPWQRPVENYRLANTQETQTMAGREPIRAADLAEYRAASELPDRIR